MRSLPLASLLAITVGCATFTPRGDDSHTAPAVSAIPPMPVATGPLALRVVYPRADAFIEARDSTFIFGSVAHGEARLRINGHDVQVHPNGSFLAFLPVPAHDRPEYVLEAAAGADTVRATHIVRVLPRRVPLPLGGPLVVDSASVAPTATASYPAAEPVRVSVRAPRNATVWLELAGGETRALVSWASFPDGARFGEPDLFATSVPASRLAEGAALVAARGSDTVRLRVAPLQAIDARWVTLAPDARAANDTDRVVSARPTRGGTNRWLLLPGTRVEMTAAEAQQVRVRLDDRVQGWIAVADAVELPAGAAPPVRIARSIRVVSESGWVDLSIPMSEPAPHLVESVGDRLTLTLYGTRSEIDNVRYLPPDDFVRLVDWTQETEQRVQVRVHTARAPLGYQALWRDGAFVLRIRRTPEIDGRAPLRGLTIAVDAGHPPGGATGPTGLYEAEAVLVVAERLRAMLEARGASVLMTRATRDPVDLYARAPAARRAGAHAFVSIHLNALPDGVNPFAAHGTSTYFFHPGSARLARLVHEGMVARLGLRDLGVFRGDLAVLRPTWMPAVLCEGAFVMIPEQEWMMRTAEGQGAYARGVADGLEQFFRELGGAR